MNQHVNNTSSPRGTEGSERPIYEPPVLIDCGTVAALTLGSGGMAGSDAWGGSGAGGGS